MKTARLLADLADRLTPIAGPLLSRIPARVRVPLFSALFAVAGTLGLRTDSEAAAVLAVVAWAIGGAVDALISWRKRQIEKRHAALIGKITQAVDRSSLRDVVLAVIACGSLLGCSHWHAGLQRAAIEASAAGQVEYLSGRGIEGSGEFRVETSATLKVCRDRACMPTTVTVETTDGAHVTVCASVWRLTTCEVVP